MKYTLHPALEDGTDRAFRNVGKPQSDAGEIPKRIHTRFKTRRKFEIKKTKACWRLKEAVVICKVCVLLVEYMLIGTFHGSAR